MPVPADLKPTRKPRVFDLVRQAGVDVDDWSNYQHPEKPAANPKYCYSWSFVEPNALIVLNLWFNKMIEANGGIEQHLNFRSLGARNERSAARKARRQQFEEAVALAYRTGLPVRVVVLDGKNSEVSARLLDPISWAVTAYNKTTGEATVRRGAATSPYTDQFLLPPPPDGTTGTRTVTSTVRNRDREVRDFALNRAKGKCELCGTSGFQLPDGRMFLETHHVISLAEHGTDSVSNVVALCPNHHREAHYGRNAKVLRTQLLKMLKVSNDVKSCGAPCATR